ncbi:cupin domain-containing protein [Streptomyces massasporeus]|uniref:cupin domain-containing protein n=1 Tax=Streptomyces massasporeus TaxID=67324 RepID=UPI00331A08DA
MPPLAVIEAPVGTCPVSPLAFEEIARVEPGQQILLDRTMDLMLITALRAWFTRPGAEIPTWHAERSRRFCAASSWRNSSLAGGPGAVFTSKISAARR